MHSKMKKWYTLYRDSKKLSVKSLITEPQLNLIRFIVSSNTALSQLANPYLLKILMPELKMPCFETFRNTFLPQVLRRLKTEFEIRLNKAISITLIPDGWSTTSQVHYLGNELTFDDLCFNEDNDSIVSFASFLRLSRATNVRRHDKRDHHS